MKKTILFLTVFLFFGFVSAEEVKNESIELQPQSENTQQAVSETDKTANASREKNEKPKFFYIQPAVGFGTGMSFYRFTVALDADFLIAHTPSVNFYVGLDLDFRKPFFLATVDFAVQTNGVVDIVIGGSELKSLSIWTSLGLDISGGGLSHLVYMPGWGTGFDFVFDNNVILKVGIDGFLGIYPDLTLLVGYRF
ncbi:hypothetical protein IKO70_00585 [bacterium]|nr:hypothetical protein [bacterium]